MIKNYFKIAWRNMLRNKAFSAINIIGLALGVAACILILQYVAFELSYDNFHKNGEQIYRVRQDRYNEGKLSTQWAAGAYAVGNSFKDAYPEVQDYVKLLGRGKSILDYGDKSITIEKSYLASSSFFTMFSYPLIEGNPKTALTDANTIVLSESVAKRLFGNENPIGKTIKANKRRPFKITGIYKDIPANSHLKSDLFVSYATFLADVKPENPENAWQWDGCLTMGRLPDIPQTEVRHRHQSIGSKVSGTDR